MVAEAAVGAGDVPSKDTVWPACDDGTVESATDASGKIASPVTG